MVTQKRYAREEEYAESLHTYFLNRTILVCFPEHYADQKRLSVKIQRLKGIDMTILKYFSVILVGLTATVSQAEIAIVVPTAEEPLERASAPSDATPSEVELKVAPLRLTLDLADGSHIRGVPSITSVPVQTSYAKMDIPLEKIVSLEINDDHDTASFELQNGDKLRGVLNLKPLQLGTVFGQVSVSIEHVTRIAVLPRDYAGHRYLIVNQLSTWQEAMSHAEAVGGHLVTIEDSDENEVVAKLLRMHGCRAALWIGLTDVRTEGTFEWITGEALRFSNWGRGEPSNRDSRGRRQDYGVIRADGTWDDGWSNGLAQAVVEFEEE
jgi:hypothetical protein